MKSYKWVLASNEVGGASQRRRSKATVRITLSGAPENSRYFAISNSKKPVSFFLKIQINTPKRRKKVSRAAADRTRGATLLPKEIISVVVIGQAVWRTGLVGQRRQAAASTAS